MRVPFELVGYKIDSFSEDFFYFNLLEQSDDLFIVEVVCFAFAN